MSLPVCVLSLNAPAVLNGLASSVYIARTAEGTHITMEFDIP